MTIKPMSVWIGFDPRETAAFMVARESVRQFDRTMPVAGVRLRHLQEQGSIRVRRRAGSAALG